MPPSRLNDRSGLRCTPRGHGARTVLRRWPSRAHGRGRVLVRSAISSRSRSENRWRSAPLARYWRKSRFAFSFEPRCHGLRGSQKYTSIPSCAASCWCSAISRPRSQVSDRRNAGASWASSAAIARVPPRATIRERQDSRIQNRERSPHDSLSGLYRPLILAHASASHGPGNAVSLGNIVAILLLIMVCF